MTKMVERQSQPVSVDEFLSGASGLPEKLELVRGEVGPFSEQGMLTLLANWGADRILAATGADVWREALKACESN